MSRPLAACVFACAALVLTGCGSPTPSGADKSEAATSPAASPAAPTRIEPSEVAAPSTKSPVAVNGRVDTGPTDLTITVRPDKDADPTTWTLTCHPTGGDHPKPQQACDALGAVGGAAGLSIPADRMCIQVYGGPATASIRGTLDGNRVDATLAQTDGCLIAQWNALSDLLGSEIRADS